MTSNTAALVDRHRAFWRLAVGNDPLSDIGPYVPVGQLEMPTRRGSDLPEEGYLRPEVLDPEHYALQACEQLEGPASPHNALLPVITPYYPVPWIEAMCGCPVQYSVARGSMSALPLPGGWDEARRVRVRRDNPWLQKLLQFVDALIQTSNGRYPVAVGRPMRGPVDLLASAVGSATASLAFLDRPQEARDLLKRFTEIWIEVVGAQLARLPAFRGGWVTSYGVWAPGRNAVTQCDLAIMLSPKIYAEFLVPCDQAICAALEVPIIHVHSGAIHLIDPILEGTSFAALEVSIDPHGPNVYQLIPILQGIQHCNRPLFILAHGSLTPGELDALLAALRPEGLYIMARLRPGGATL